MNPKYCGGVVTKFTGGERGTGILKSQLAFENVGGISNTEHIPQSSKGP